jgi:hypothetical protein
VACVVLLEAAPGLVPEAAPRLRRGLNAARFHQIYAGHLLIVHPSLSTALAPAELAAQLALALEREVPLMLPGGDAWPARCAACWPRPETAMASRAPCRACLSR